MLVRGIFSKQTKKFTRVNNSAFKFKTDKNPSKSIKIDYLIRHSERPYPLACLQLVTCLCLYSSLNQVQRYAGNVKITRRIVELKKKTLKYTRTECYQSSKSALNLRNEQIAREKVEKILNTMKY